MRERKLTGRAASMPFGLAIGALVSVLITVIVSAIGSHLIMSEIISQEHIGYCSIATLLAGTILGTIVSARMVKHRKLVVCLIGGFIYFVILLSATALFFGGQYEGIIVTFTTICIGSVASALMTSREAGGHSKAKRKKSHHKLMQYSQELK